MIIHKDFSLASVLRYQFGGKAKYFLSCTSREDILEAVAFIKTHSPQKIFVCGTGANVIFTDEYFDGVVIHIVSTNAKPDIRMTKEGLVSCFGGELLETLIQYSFAHNLQGLGWAGGLPGTVGAGVRGNVGAYGSEVKDSLISAEVIDYSESDPQVRTYTNKQLDFVYRGSMIKTNKHMLVLSAMFRLVTGTDQQMRDEKQLYDEHIANRKAKHPLEYPNCGSVFKNIKDPLQIQKVLAVFPDLQEYIETKWYGKVSMAHLIERLGLKGMRIGNAQISEKHALFIVNLGNAKAADVLALIHTVQETFQKELGFTPETEVEIVR